MVKYLVLLAILISGLVGCSPSEEERKKILATEASQKSVRGFLEYPLDASFPSTPPTFLNLRVLVADRGADPRRPGSPLNGYLVVESTVKAKNTFGATLTSEWLVVMKPDENGGILDENGGIWIGSLFWRIHAVRLGDKWVFASEEWKEHCAASARRYKRTRKSAQGNLPEQNQGQAPSPYKTILG